jgi:hypothetical protein
MVCRKVRCILMMCCRILIQILRNISFDEHYDNFVDVYFERFITAEEPYEALQYNSSSQTLLREVLGFHVRSLGYIGINQIQTLLYFLVIEEKC